MKKKLIQFLVIISILTVLAYLQSETRDFNHTLTVYVFTFAILIGAYFLFIHARHTYRLIRYLNHPTKIEVKDISDRGLSVPEIAEVVEQELLSVGFKSIGEKEVSMPYFLPIINYQYKQEHGEILATVYTTGSTPVVRFLSSYPDQSHLETTYPYGYDIDTPFLRSYSIWHSVAKALTFHQLQMEVLGKDHGKPLQLPTNSKDEEQDIELTLIRINHVLQRQKLRIAIYSATLLFLVSSWLRLLEVDVIDIPTWNHFMLSLVISAILNTYLLFKENQHYADKRKFQKNQV